MSGPSAVAAAPGIGRGWRAIADALGAELRAIDPEATVDASFGSKGLLQLNVRSALPHHDARELVRRYESRAVRTCETCGRAGSVRSGVVLLVACDRCAGR